MEHWKHSERLLYHIISTPFIWMMIIPTIILHVFLEIYHHICFRLYGIPLVDPAEYIRFDRAKLPYLPLRDKINCLYCSYVNGVFRYAAEIAGRTERYWCGIKHQVTPTFKGHPHQKDFMEYGDEKAYRKYHPK